jgi:hypothetical protein
MKTPPPTVTSAVPTAPKGPRGRFIGLVATGKERYQVVLLETVGDVVVKRVTLMAGRTDMVQGKQVTGDPLPNALLGINVALAKHLREATDLWAVPA